MLTRASSRPVCRRRATSGGGSVDLSTATLAIPWKCHFNNMARIDVSIIYYAVQVRLRHKTEDAAARKKRTGSCDGMEGVVTYHHQCPREHNLVGRGGVGLAELLRSSRYVPLLLAARATFTAELCLIRLLRRRLLPNSSSPCSGVDGLVCPPVVCQQRPSFARISFAQPAPRTAAQFLASIEYAGPVCVHVFAVKETVETRWIPALRSTNNDE